MSWTDHAACKGQDTGLFFPTGSKDLPATRQAIAEFCCDCPVRAECAAAGKGQREGVWGGELRWVPRSEQRFCPQCEGEFWCQPGSNKRFCSACRWRRANRSATASDEKSAERKCPECGTAFLTTISHQVTCGPKCGRARDRRKARERWRRSKGEVA